MNRRLEIAILVPVVIVIVSGIAALGAFSFFRTRASLQEEIVPDLVIARAGDAKSIVEARMAAAIETARLLAEDPTTKFWIEAGEDQDAVFGNLLYQRLDALVKDYRYDHAFYVSDQTRNYYADGFRVLDVMTSDDPDDQWFFDAMEMEDDYALNLDYNQELGASLLFVNVPVTVAGSQAGVAGLGLNLTSVVPPSAARDGGELFLVNPDGQILAAANAAHIGNTLQNYLPGMASSDIENGNAQQFTRNDQELDSRPVGGAIFAASQQVLDSTYYLVATVPTTIIDATLNQIRNITLLTGAIVVAAAFMLLLIIVRKAVRSVLQISDQLQEISTGDGDLSKQLTVDSKNEIGLLAERFNTFVDTLRNLIRDVAAGSEALAAEKEEIVANATETASSVNQITGNITSVSSSVDRLHDSIRTTAEKTQEITTAIGAMEEQINAQVSAIEETSASVEQMNAQSDSIRNTAAKRAGEVEELTNAVAKSSSRLEELGTKAQELERRTGQMLEAANVINGIAAQTNLLSMNAAIEAAHAGDAGRGFSVVAEEIRKLAENSSNNATVIQNSLKGSVTLIQEINGSFETMQGTFHTVADSTHQTRDAFSEIESTVSELSTGMNEVTGAVVAIRDAIMSIDERSKTVTGLTGEIRTLNEQNSSIGSEVQGAITEIRTGADQINQSVNNLNNSLQELSESVNRIHAQVSRFQT
ncbi:MAG: methyl-accepting chemotaxis protein [Alkalispirochaeta sp.]